MTTTRAEIEQLIAATGKYELLVENQEGMNAYAFRAIHIPLEKQVFLKVIAPDPEGELFAEPRFLVEATADNAENSNLVRVYDADRLGEEYVLIALESVEGGSVLSRMGAGPLSMMDSVVAGIGILHGVAQLHRALLVHRDIKPANVLLAERYGRVWAKVADFGSIARLPESDGAVTASRHSALYVPPEGWETPSRFDVRSDIYQVGVVLFEMAHGPLPYDDTAYLDRQARKKMREKGARSLEQLDSFERCQLVDRSLARISSTKRVTSLGKMQPYVPPSLARVINKATAPNPIHRYQTASEMLGILEALHLPDWHCHSENEEYTAHAWRGWDWCVKSDAKEPEKWLVRIFSLARGGGSAAMSTRGLHCRSVYDQRLRWQTT
jgi:serine/threonine protein kinase